MKTGANWCEADHGVVMGQQTADPPYSEILDWEGLCNRCMGNLDLVERVLKKFQQWLPEELTELERAMECGDTEQIAHLAHRIKGTSASVSAPGLQRVAEQVEELGRAGRLTELSTCVGLLQREWARYQDHWNRRRESTDRR